MPVASEKAGAAATGHSGPAGRQSSESALRIGGVDAVDQVQRGADHGAAVGVEHQYLAEVGDHQQTARGQEAGRHRHPDHRLTPPDPLGRRKRQHRSGLADVEVVEIVEQRAGEAPAQDEPGAPALPRVIVGLPDHQRAASGGLAVDGQVIAGAERHLGGEVALDGTCPLQTERVGPADRRVAAVRGIGVLSGPARGRAGLDPGIGIAAAGESARDQRRCGQRGDSPEHGIPSDSSECSAVFEPT